MPCPQPISDPLVGKVKKVHGLLILTLISPGLYYSLLSPCSPRSPYNIVYCFTLLGIILFLFYFFEKETIMEAIPVDPDLYAPECAYSPDDWQS